MTSIAYYTFYNCKSLTSVIMMEDVKTINDYAFSGCTNLTSIRLSEGLKYICSRAFEYCYSLTDITLPESLKTIGRLAFNDCLNLTSGITLPENMTYIGEYAFAQCPAKRYCSMDSETAVLLGKEGYSFYDNGLELQYEVLNDEVRGMCLNGVENADMASCIVPEGVTSIGKSAFSGCDNLMYIKLPVGLKTVGDNALTSCKRVLVPGWNTQFASSALPSDAVVYCHENSAAWNNALENGWKTVLLDGTELDSLEKFLAVTRTMTLYTNTEHRKHVAYDVFPVQGSDAPVWTSSNLAVAVVDSDGMVTALRNGSATITLTLGSLRGSCEVTVHTQLTDFALSDDEVYVLPRKTVQLKPVFQLASADVVLDFEWYSGDDNVASVDSTGTITGKAIGDTTVTATAANGVTRSCVVHVCYPPTAVVLASDTLRMGIGQSRQLTANVTTDSQSLINQLVRFESSDPAVATVDENGVVRSLKSGTVTITAASIGDSSIAATCTVKVLSSLTTLALPSGIKTIEAEAFLKDTALTAVKLPSGMETIGAAAFKGCTKLAYIEIPATVTSIADDAFSGCGELTISCPKGSKAESFAKEKGIAHVCE